MNDLYITQYSTTRILLYHGGLHLPALNRPSLPGTDSADVLVVSCLQYINNKSQHFTATIYSTMALVPILGDKVEGKQGPVDVASLSDNDVVGKFLTILRCVCFLVDDLTSVRNVCFYSHSFTSISQVCACAVSYV